MDEDPQAVLESIEEDSDGECLYVDRDEPHDAYIWKDPDGDGYQLLQRSSSGTWFQPGPLTADGAVKFLERVSEDVAVEVRPQTELPPGRHPSDKI